MKQLIIGAILMSLFGCLGRDSRSVASVGRAAADAFCDDAWHTRILDTYGEPGRIESFDAPLVLAKQEL